MSNKRFLRIPLGRRLISSMAFLAARLKVFCGTRNYSAAPVEVVSTRNCSDALPNFLRTSKANACSVLFSRRPVSKWECSLVLIYSSDSAYSPKKLWMVGLRQWFFNCCFWKAIFSFRSRFSSLFLFSLARALAVLIGPLRASFIAW